MIDQMAKETNELTEFLEQLTKIRDMLESLLVASTKYNGKKTMKLGA